ncbi:MAG: kinase/pyrophosphorylase [Myxococcales bacterium]|nr:kinase/pyrophosphorylase [Myxococcales bacterium]
MAQARYIDILSDSTGETAERVVRAALLQFPQAEVELRRHLRVRTAERVEPILRQVADEPALLVFSVVSPELSAYIHRMTEELGIEAIDVIGGVIGKLTSFLGCKPLERPGALMPLSAEYFRRIEAIEFTVKSEAGREARALTNADVVLVGVSRTSKTPLATLLAQRGLKVATVTLTMGQPLPAELADTRLGRAFGLAISVDNLCELRQEQLVRLGMSSSSFASVRVHVESEVRFAAQVFADHPSWPVIDVSGRSVEETAAILLELRTGRSTRPPRS